MKKLILFLVGLAIAVPSGAFAIEKFERTGKIETDKSGGYTETQRDPHSRRKKQIDDKTGAAYYNGSYHSTGQNYQPGEWQFVEPSGGSGSSKHKSHKSYKKVQETEKSGTKKTTK